MIKTLDINIVNLSSIAEANRLKEFASFLYLKSLYSNSCVFNYTQVGLSKKSGLPLSNIKKCVKSFLSSGWCRVHKGNLVFNKIKSFDHNKKKIIASVEITNPKQILKDLQKLILNNLQDKFNRLVRLKADLLNSYPKISRSAQRKVERLGLDPSKLPGENDMLSVSMNKIGKLFGCSVGSAASVIKELKTNGSILCVTERKLVEVHSLGVKPIMQEMPNTYYHNGNLFIVSCNKYIFNK